MAHASLAALAALALALPGTAAALSEPSGLDGKLRASSDEEPALLLSGAGTHVYTCRAMGTDPETYAWAFVAPDATLREGTRSVARHASLNQWESTVDASSVGGSIRAAQAAGGDNLPWLLMRATPAGDAGLFAGVTSIQRVNTQGGVAPAGGCDANHQGEESRVAFSADYYFYKRRGG
jgi:hypothetical protein